MPVPAGNKTIYPPSGYTALQSSISANGSHVRGSALLINININYQSIPLITTGNIEAVAVEIWLDKFYTVCSFYLSASLNVQRRDVGSLLAQLQKPFLILREMERGGEKIPMMKKEIYLKDYYLKKTFHLSTKKIRLTTASSTTSLRLLTCL